MKTKTRTYVVKDGPHYFEGGRPAKDGGNWTWGVRFAKVFKTRADAQAVVRRIREWNPSDCAKAVPGGSRRTR